jgi:hypothetical protein
VQWSTPQHRCRLAVGPGHPGLDHHLGIGHGSSSSTSPPYRRRGRPPAMDVHGHLTTGAISRLGHGWSQPIPREGRPPLGAHTGGLRSASRSATFA